MCGIAGVWGKGDIRVMTDILSHRGPDGVNIVKGDTVSLGASSLKIADPSGGYQPFTNETGTMVVALNGEIYNYREIKSELCGHTFKTDTDTEVLLHAYEEFGIECVKRFNGCFAFAIWDGKELILGRDRMGQKPLYYYRDGDRFMFASEIKSILLQVKAAPSFSRVSPM